LKRYAVSNPGKTQVATLLDSYIVRVYRRSTDAGAQAITGIVEWPARNERTAFHNLAELEAILLADPHPRRSREALTRKARSKRS
jgi:hypothetical protein